MPLHSSLGNKSEIPSQKKKEKKRSLWLAKMKAEKGFFSYGGANKIRIRKKVGGEWQMEGEKVRF